MNILPSLFIALETEAMNCSEINLNNEYNDGKEFCVCLSFQQVLQSKYAIILILPPINYSSFYYYSLYCHPHALANHSQSFVCSALRSLRSHSECSVDSSSFRPFTKPTNMRKVVVLSRKRRPPTWLTNASLWLKLIIETHSIAFFFSSLYFFSSSTAVLP